MPEQPITDVIFRKWRNGGDILAIFPGLPGTNDPYTCSSYAHVGQHGACSVPFPDDTKPATPAEYADLKAELERIGYRLRVIRRHTRKHLQARIDEVDEMEGFSYGR